MPMTRWGWTILAAAVSLAGTAPQAKPVWREAFQSSPATYAPPSDVFIKFATQNWRVPAEQLRAQLTPQPVTGTVRYRITVQVAGSQIRVRLSNEEGATPLTLAGASVGLAAEAFTAQAGSLHRLTFGGASGVTIPPGAPMLSDPIALPVKRGTDLVVSAALAAPMMVEGRGGAGFVQAAGDQSMQDALEKSAPMTGRPLVTGVSVLTDQALRVIVTLGDSITDGNRATAGALHGWPEVLSRRLAARGGSARYSVVNAGIAGNRVLASGWGSSALARLDRDALRVGGITHLVLLEGINDINFSGNSPFGANPEISSADIINGYRQIIARAHARGVKVYVGTLTPNPGDSQTSTPAMAAMRDEVNHWVRTSGEPDGIIDFDAIVRDPAMPSRLKPEYDSGDHLHPSDRGYQAMGEGINLAIFP